MGRVKRARTNSAPKFGAGQRIEVYFGPTAADRWMRGVSKKAVVVDTIVSTAAHPPMYRVLYDEDEDGHSCTAVVDEADVRDPDRAVEPDTIHDEDALQLWIPEGRDAFHSDGTKLFVPGPVWADVTVAIDDEDQDEEDDEHGNVLVVLPEWSSRFEGVRKCIRVDREDLRKPLE